MLNSARRFAAFWLCVGLVLLPGIVKADPATGARLMADAAAEAGRIPDGAARTRAVLEIARIQHGAGLISHGRDALRQTAEAIWRAHGGQPEAVRNGWRAGLLAETAETACGLGFKDDATAVLTVAAKIADDAGPAARVRLLRAAILCQNAAASEALWRILAANPNVQTVQALSVQGLAGQAEALWRRMDAAGQQASAPAAADALARLGYVQAARRIDPNVKAPAPSEMLPELLAQAEARRLIGDKTGAEGFLQAAERQIRAAPAYRPAIAAAYADIGDIDQSKAAIRNGGDSPAARAALATAYARAGDISSARRMLGTASDPSALPALAAIAKAASDAATASTAQRIATAMPPGRAKAIALAHAAAAAIGTP